MEPNIENQTKQVIEQYYQNLASKNFEANIQLFSKTVEWRIPGNALRATWIKDRNNRDEVRAFFKELYENLEGLSFEVTGKFYNGHQAVVTGHIVSRILSTGKLFDSYFTVQFTVVDGLISKYLMLEDSYALIESLRQDEAKSEKIPFTKLNDSNTTSENKDSLQNRQRNYTETYFRKVDAGEFDRDYYNLFTENAELYFPKFGFGYGEAGIRKFGETMSGFLKGLAHDIENFNYIVSENVVVVEGTEKGVTFDGKPWPDNVTAFGKFCNVFEFEGDLIKRVHIYVDPDVTSEDNIRMEKLSNSDANGHPKVEKYTEEVVRTFFDILSGKSEEKIINLFADNVDWDMPGNMERFSWLGKRSTKEECANFFEEHPKVVKQEKFEIDFISFNGENAVAVGNLSAKILKYNKIYSSHFSAIFKVQNGKIIKYHFMEDSHKLNEEMK